MLRDSKGEAHIVAPGNSIQPAFDDPGPEMIPWRRHGWQHLPAVSRRVVPREIVDSAPIPESSNCIDVLLDDSGSQGPPPGWHPCLGGPAIGLRVVLQHQVYGCPARVPPKHVQFATGHPCRGVIECDRQGLHELPAVSRECIGFNRIGLAAVATEASDHIHLPLEGSDTDLLASFLQASPPKPGCLRSPIGSWHLPRASTSSTAASYKDAQADTQHCMQGLLRHRTPPRKCEA